MRDVVKPGAVLFLLTAVMALLLGLAQAFAAGPIETNARVAKEKALERVLPAASDLAVKWGEFSTGEATGVTAYSVAGTTEGVVGWAVTAEGKGYGGKVRVLVGISQDGDIEGVQILSHNETPGLGANATKESWIGQFTGKRGGLSVVKGAAGDGQIQAITSSTITSKAVTNAVNEAYAFYERELKGGAK